MNFTEKIKYLMEEYPNTEVKTVLYDVDAYTIGNIKDVCIDRLALYTNEDTGYSDWIDRDDYEEIIYGKMYRVYYDQTDKFIDEKVQEEMEKIEFKNFICIIVGN